MLLQHLPCCHQVKMVEGYAGAELDDQVLPREYGHAIPIRTYRTSGLFGFCNENWWKACVIGSSRPGFGIQRKCEIKYWQSTQRCLRSLTKQLSPSANSSTRETCTRGHETWQGGQRKRHFSPLRYTVWCGHIPFGKNGCPRMQFDQVSLFKAKNAILSNSAAPPPLPHLLLLRKRAPWAEFGRK
ncbi:unnamed protein product [Ectocarpus sp. 8 AP-2014]